MVTKKEFLFQKESLVCLVCLVNILISGAPPHPAQALAALSAEELDVLMKYLYRGLAMPKRDQEHYKGLLKWHPKVLATAGPASIVRVMAEVGRPL